MRAALYPNPRKTEALECAERVREVLVGAGIEVLDFAQAAGCDFVIAIGGDGTMLRCAKKIIGYNTKLLGVNMGKLGFMASLESDELEKMALLRQERYTVSERMMLQGKLWTMAGTRGITALNDISISTNYSKSGDFEVYKAHDVASDAGDFLIGRYRADGVLFSTPTGSTAYALSAGGPVIEPDLECIEMTLICPHTFFSRPMIFAPDRVLSVRNVSENDEKSQVCISVDGEEPIPFRRGDRLDVRMSEFKIKMVDIDGNSFHESLASKLMRSIK